MARKKRKVDVQGRAAVHIKIDAKLINDFQILSMQHSINTGEKQGITSLMADLMDLAVRKPEILNQITDSENNE